MQELYILKKNTVYSKSLRKTVTFVVTGRNT